MKHACERVSQLASEALDRKLSLTERFQLTMHLSMCGLCRNYHKSLKTMHAIFDRMRKQELRQDIHMPEDAKQRVQSVLEKENTF